jgi:c-di-GMP-binding flagellar brake protein YcgR
MNDQSTRPSPEPEIPEYEQYLTYSRREIIEVIQEVIDSGALVTVYFSQGDDHFVTNLLQINPEFEELIFDAAPEAALAERLLQSRRATFVAFLDQIKIQFHALRVEATTREGRPAARIRLPDSLLRLQRRNYFRVAAPKATPLQCGIPLPGRAAPARFAISDLSVGGLAVIAGPQLADLAAGTVFHNCSIELPGHGSITVSLEIRNLQGGAQPKEAARMRYGCQFLNLGGPTVSLIQRYINQLQRTQRTLV